MKKRIRKGFVALAVFCILLVMIPMSIFAADTYSVTITVNLDGAILADTAITYTLDGGTAQNASTSASGQIVLNLTSGFHRIAVTYNSNTIENAVTGDKPGATYNFITGGGAATYYTVVYKDWDGNFLKAVSVASGEAAVYGTNPTRAGYTFTNWVLESDAANNAADELLSVAGDLTVKAKYTAATSGSYTLSRNGVIYSSSGKWFKVDVTRGNSEQLSKTWLKIRYMFGAKQIIVPIALTVDKNGDSIGNVINVPIGVTAIYMDVCEGNAADWYAQTRNSTTLELTSFNIGN